MRFLLLFLAAVAFAQETAPSIPSLVADGNAAYVKGDYETARGAFLRAWDAAQQTPPTDPVRYDVLKRLVAIRAAAGEFADADNFLQMAINWKENTYGQNDLRVVEDLLQSVQLCRGMKDFERALVIVNRVMTMHRLNGGTETATYADDLTRMAVINMEKKNVPTAVVWFNQAISLRTKVAGPLDPSLINDLDRVAGAYIVMREYAHAEEAYRRALVIRETLLGKFDADLIATIDGLAYSCFGQKKYDEAEPLYQRLIALWQKSVGEDHPMVALALDKVATFYAEQKKYDQAKDATDRAIAIRAHFLGEGLAGAATEQIAEGNKDAAVGLYKRALLVMDPPHPIYDELRKETEEIVKGMAAPPPKPPAKAPARRPPTKSRRSDTIARMKRNFVLAGLVLLAFAALASATDLTGTWQGSFNFQDQAVPLKIDLKGSSDITGNVTGLPSGVAEIKDGKLDGDNLTFYVMTEYQGSPIKLVYKGKVAGNEIKFAFGTEDGAWGTEFVAKKS